MTTPPTITDLYRAAQHTSARNPAWDALRAAEAAELPRCTNHPDRVMSGEWYVPLCLECIEAKLPYFRLWQKSCELVRGGVAALKGSHI